MKKLMKNSAIALFMLMTAPAFAISPPKDIIPKEKAEKIALSAAGGTVKSSELEYELNQWVYSFDITGADQKIHEVLVNAKTGKVVKNSIESAAREATEMEHEKK